MVSLRGWKGVRGWSPKRPKWLVRALAALVAPPTPYLRVHTAFYTCLMSVGVEVVARGGCGGDGGGGFLVVFSPNRRDP
jgi:hypothetical protein